MLRVYLEEEYGFRNWDWFYPGAKEELVEDWKNGEAPLNFFNPSIGKYKGEMEKVEEEDLEEWIIGSGQENSIKAHVHDEDDTYLCVDGKVYYRESVGCCCAVSDFEEK